MMIKIIKSGFTLIELLIVMAILGVLATLVLVLINPGEQLTRARDAGRISAVNQLGHQVQSYYTTKEGTYPVVSQWDQDLVDTNQLASFPQGSDYAAASGITNCTTNERPAASPTYCYSLDTVNDHGALVFAKLEALNQRSKCTVSGEYPYFVYSTVDGRGGVICFSADPVPWSPGTQTYIN